MENESVASVKNSNALVTPVKNSCECFIDVTNTYDSFTSVKDSHELFTSVIRSHGMCDKFIICSFSRPHIFLSTTVCCEKKNVEETSGCS